MNALLSLGGWSIVPDLATQYILKFIYQTPIIYRTLRITPAAPSTPQHRRHYGVTFALVVLGYLFYTLIEKAINAPPNFYEILGVPYTVDDNGLKLAFRHFARRNHPDRPGVGKSGEEVFMHVRDMFEALKDPAVRFAYDRFGPDALRWRQKCSTSADFLWHGLSSSSGYHIAGFAFLLFWSAVGRSTAFTFWRYILFFSLLAAELALILSPSPSASSQRHITFLHKLFPNRVVYQHILFLHQIFMFLNVALMRVTPHLLPVDEFADPMLEQALLDRTTALINIADRETSKMIHTELQSIAHDPSSQSQSSSSTTSSAHIPLPGPHPHHPSLARLEPVSAETATRLLGELAPEMEALILEMNVKQGAGPLKTAWETAVKRVHTRLVAEAEAERERERQEEEEGELHNGASGSAPSSRETTPTPQSQSRSSSPRKSTHLTSSTPVRIKTEPHDGDVAGSGYFMVSPKSKSSPPSTPTHSGIPRSLIKSVPRTPGELPSPRPSPSPPPPPSPGPRRVLEQQHANNGFRPFAMSMSPQMQARVPGQGQQRVYLAGSGEEEGEAQQYATDRIRARSVSC